MHEFGIAQRMLQVALDHAAQNHAQRITAFHIELSTLADESEEALRFYFAQVARGTAAEGARVNIVRVPMRAQCSDCGNEFAFTTPTLACPQCASKRIHVLLEDEFRLASIEVV